MTEDRAAALLLASRVACPRNYRAGQGRGPGRGARRARGEFPAAGRESADEMTWKIPGANLLAHLPCALHLLRLRSHSAFKGLRTEAGSYRLPDASFYRLPDKMAPSPVDEALLGTPARAPSSIRKALSPLGTGRQVKAADHALRTADGLSVAEMSPSPGEFRGEFRAVTSQIANPSSRWIAPFEVN
eukprot:COSAG06_NODE_3501_length_5261_cov_2.961062_3_plen_187_part_00